MSTQNRAMGYRISCQLHHVLPVRGRSLGNLGNKRDVVPPETPLKPYVCVQAGIFTTFVCLPACEQRIPACGHSNSVGVYNHIEIFSTRKMRIRSYQNYSRCNQLQLHIVGCVLHVRSQPALAQ